MLLLFHVVQYHHAGEQKMPREKRSKELTSFEMVISFVSLVTGRPLLSIMAVLHHVDDHLSVRTTLWHCSIAALLHFFGKCHTIIMPRAQRRKRTYYKTYVLIRTVPYNISQNLIGYGVFRKHPISCDNFI